MTPQEQAMNGCSGENDAPRILAMNSELPTLHIPYPVCGHCGEDVTIEDGYPYCEGCLIQWDRIEDGRVAKPDDMREDTEIPCQIVVGKQNDSHEDKRGNRYVPGPPKPCILPSGHEGTHLCPYDVEVTRVTPPAETTHQEER